MAKVSQGERVLKIRGLAQTRGERWLFQNVNISVVSGSTLVLAGPNGSGKTTFLRTVAGFLKPQEGYIELSGAEDVRELAQELHFLGHLNALKPNVTALDNLAVWVRLLAGDKSPERVSLSEALERLEINPIAERRPGSFRAGRHGRLARARLLGVERPFWLPDGGTAALDASGTALVAEMIDAHTERGGLAVVSTHLAIPLARSRVLDFTAAARSRAAP